MPKEVVFESSSGTICSQPVENAGGSSKDGPPTRFCYTKLLRENDPSLGRKSRKTVVVENRGCYSKLLRDLPRGVFRRGQKLYYRHTVPVDAQRLLNRLEIWRSLRTDSLAVAMRRLPGIVNRRPNGTPDRRAKGTPSQGWHDGRGTFLALRAA
ncbi:DUF6538 domain-containing protein [Sphingobium sp. CAP-1]|uniref:DUF6538 domain-containing protein n=1 Tax=Sphingobium sp. CAP-1 TaxID=2676077 RepID=UPI003FA79050